MRGGVVCVMAVWAALLAPGAAIAAPVAIAAASAGVPPPFEALRGTVGTASVLMRVERRGEIVRGRYFHEKYGRDIPVEGVLHDGHLSLHTRNEKFDGLRAADGSVTGVWTRAEKSFPFRLEPIVRDGNARVYRKHLHEVKRGKRIDTMDEQAHPVGSKTTCTRDAKGAEVFGLASAAVEAKLNVQLASTFTESSDCEGDSEEQQERSLVIRAGRWATLTARESSMFEGAAHPNSGMSRATYDLRTGQTAGEGIKFKRALDDGFLTQSCKPDMEGRGVPDEDVDLAIYKARRFTAGESGITLTPTRTCEADRAVEFGDYDCELGYAELLKAGYLDPASPWAELWTAQGTAASAVAKVAPKSAKPARTKTLPRARRKKP